MEIIAAAQWLAEVPADLAVLRLVERPFEGPVRRLCAAGDVGFSGALADHATDPSVFAALVPLLESADLVFANLETPLLEDPAGRLFAAPIDAADQLAAAGFDLLNLANNHIRDHGPAGLAATRKALDHAGIATLGAGRDHAEAQRLVIRDLAGLRVGFLGAARTLEAQKEDGDHFWEYDAAELMAGIEAARSKIDVLVVSLHLGYMFVDYPHPGQRRDVLRFLAAGADLVLVHHAHVLQGVESTRQGLASYSLGNLLLDWREGAVESTADEESQRCGGIFVFDLDRAGVGRAAVLPTRIDDDWRVRWATGERGRQILEHLQAISSTWDDRFIDAVFHRQLAERATGQAVRTAFLELRRGRLGGLWRVLRRLRPHHGRMILGWLATRGRGSRR